MTKHFEIQIVDENGVPLQFYRPSKAKRDEIKKALRQGRNADLGRFQKEKVIDKKFDKFVEFLNDGFSLDHIAFTYGISIVRVKRILKEGGYGE